MPAAPTPDDADAGFCVHHCGGDVAGSGRPTRFRFGSGDSEHWCCWWCRRHCPWATIGDLMAAGKP